MYYLKYSPRIQIYPVRNKYHFWKDCFMYIYMSHPHFGISARIYNLLDSNKS